ncbi:MAG TPA: VOC family protein [Armatimonadota bacterium]|nr:VOC family protein [Armatimonadota bacterium]
MPDQGHNATLHGGGFHHIAIRANDFEATLRFYTEGLGFRRVYGWGEDGRSRGERDSRAVMLDTGDGNYLEVFAGGTLAPGEAIPEGALLHYALRTTNCDAALERARDAGATVTMEPKTVPINGDTPKEFRIAFVRGLDGEIIEFFQNDSL